MGVGGNSFCFGFQLYGTSSPCRMPGWYWKISFVKGLTVRWSLGKLVRASRQGPKVITTSHPWSFASQERLAQAQELQADDLCSNGTWRLSGDFKAQSRLVSTRFFLVSFLRCIGSHQMTIRQVTEDKLEIYEPCNITAHGGSLNLFQSIDVKMTTVKDLNTISSSSVYTAPLKTYACILCDMPVLQPVYMLLESDRVRGFFLLVMCANSSETHLKLTWFSS